MYAQANILFRMFWDNFLTIVKFFSWNSAVIFICPCPNEWSREEPDSVPFLMKIDRLLFETMKQPLNGTVSIAFRVY